MDLIMMIILGGNEEILEEIFFQATVLKFGDLVGAG